MDSNDYFVHLEKVAKHMMSMDPKLWSLAADVVMKHQINDFLLLIAKGRSLDDKKKERELYVTYGHIITILLAMGCIQLKTINLDDILLDNLDKV